MSKRTVESPLASSLMGGVGRVASRQDPGVPPESSGAGSRLVRLRVRQGTRPCACYQEAS